MKPYERAGKLVVAIAKDAGVTMQKQMAEKLSISQETMSKIATGSQPPHEDMIRKIEEIFNAEIGKISELGEAIEEGDNIKSGQLAGGWATSINLAREFAVICDGNVVEPQMDPAHAHLDWYGRLKWIGFHGGVNWLDLLRYEYPRDAINRSVPPLVCDTLQDIRFGVFASLEPGDGELDSLVLDGLSGKFKYIPIDIGMALLASTWKTLRDRDELQMPFAVVGEFEQNFPFIARKVKSVAGSQPIVYSLLGNTFGNLEKGESVFLQKVRSQLRKADYLLLHVSCVKEVYEVEEDPLWNHVGTRFKRFVAFAKARRTGRGVEELVREWDSNFEFRSWNSDVRLGGVAHATGFQIVDRENEKAVQILCRYSLDGLSEWVQNRGFQLVGEPQQGVDQSRAASKATVTDGVLLLKKAEV